MVPESGYESRKLSARRRSVRAACLRADPSRCFVAAGTCTILRERKPVSVRRPGPAPGIRELVIPQISHIVPYRVQRATIEILCVFHSARRWSDRL